MAKTIGQLRKEGKSFKDIARIGAKQNPKAAATLKRKSSRGSSRGSSRPVSPAKTIGQLRQEGKSFKEIARIGSVQNPLAKRILETGKRKSLSVPQQQFLLKQKIIKSKPIVKKQQQLTMQKKPISRGEIRPTPRRKANTITEKAGRGILEFQERLAREGRAEKGQKPVSSFLKRASSDLLGVATGTFSLAKTLNDATFRLPGDKKGDQARAKLKKATTLTSLKAAGGGSLQATGRDLQSRDAYERTRGILSIVTAVNGVPFAKSNKVVATANKVQNSVDLVSGNSKTIVKTSGVLDDGKLFTQNTKFKFNPKTKKLTGTQTTKFPGGKTQVEKLDFKDKGKYFEDAKGNRIEKAGIRPSDTRISIKETTTKQKAKDKLRIFEGNAFKIGKRNIEVKDTRIGLSNGKVTGAATKTRSNVVDFKKSLDKVDKGLSEAISINRNFDVSSALGKTAKQRQKINSDIQSFLIKITPKQKQAILKRLELQFKNKSRPQLVKKLELGLKGDIAVFKSTKGKIKSVAEFEELKPTFVSFGISKPKFKNGFLTPIQEKALLRVPKTITIPRLKLRIRNIKKIKGLGLIRTATATKVIKKYSNKLRELEKRKQAQPQKKAKSQKIIPKRKQKQPQAKKQVKVPARKQATTSKNINKVRPTTRKAPRLTRSQLLKEPIKPKIPKLSFDSKQLDNKILTFKGEYRQRRNPSKPTSKSNPIVKKTIKLRTTKNRALKRVGDLVDRNTARSLTLKVTGVGKSKKDIQKPKVLRKFRTKKSTNTPVLRLVEKSKFTIDKPKEKRELKRARRIKGSTSKKTKKTSKVSKKTKKSSKKR